MNKVNICHYGLIVKSPETQELRMNWKRRFLSVPVEGFRWAAMSRLRVGMSVNREVFSLPTTSSAMLVFSHSYVPLIPTPSTTDAYI